MLNSITINNFKAIQDNPDGTPKPLELKELANVNYLVGKNGCGKSSVLEMLYSLHCINLYKDIDKVKNFDPHIYEYMNFCNKNMKTFKGYKNVAIQPKSTITIDKIIHKFKLDYKTGVIGIIPKLINFEVFKLQKTNIEQKDDLTLRLDSIESCIREEYNESISYAIQKGYGAIDINNNSLCNIQLATILRDGLSLSDGEYFMNNLMVLLLSKFSDLESLTPYIFVLEEDISGFHPSFQKKIPILLDLFVKSALSNNLDIQFFVATHSPFIISEASKYSEDQKVYLIENGQTRGLQENSLGQGQDGFVGGECLLAVNQMLGVSMSDFVPTHLYLCERSLSIFIKSFCVAQKTKIQPVFLCEKGDSAVLTKGQIWKQLLTFYNQANKDGAFKVNLKIIIDVNSEIKQQVQGFKFPEDLIQLQTTEQELLYQESIYKNSQIIEKDWDRVVHPGIVEFYETKIDQDLLAKGKEKEKKQTVGKLKCEFAKYVGEHITKEQFEAFCPELHNLIFN